MTKIPNLRFDSFGNVSALTFNFQPLDRSSHIAPEKYSSKLDKIQNGKNFVEKKANNNNKTRLKGALKRNSRKTSDERC